MRCKRCGRFCPERKERLCFHCLVGIGIGFIDSKRNKLRTMEELRQALTKGNAK